MNRFTYPLLAIRVIDGDTIDVTLDLGFRMTYAVKVRIQRIDAPELHDPRQQPAAEVSKQAAIDWLAKFKLTDLVFQSLKPDKHEDRYVGDIIADGAEPPVSRISFSTYMLRGGYARAYAGDAKPPWTDEELAAIVKLKK